MFAILNKSRMIVGETSMRLSRREILEELGRLGITRWCELKKACREFETYWDSVRCND